MPRERFPKGDGTVKENNSLLSWVIGAALLALGILILYAKENWLDAATPFAHIVEEIAIAIVLAGVLETVWEIFRKRRFLTEVREALCKDDTVLDAGIDGVIADLYGEIDWDKCFNESGLLAISFAFGSTWRGQNMGRVRNFVKRSNTTLKVLLPDHRNPGVIESLARQFNKTETETKLRITEALSFFLDIRNERDAKSTVQIFLTTRPLTWTAYVFKRRAIWCLYSHGNQKGAPPYFVLDSDGSLYRHVVTEMNHYFNKQNPVTEVPDAIKKVTQLPAGQSGNA